VKVGKMAKGLQGLKWWILFCSPYVHYSQEQKSLSCVLMRVEGLGVADSAEVSLRACTLNLLGDR
jgi:hypothetical protein